MKERVIYGSLHGHQHFSSLLIQLSSLKPNQGQGETSYCIGLDQIV